VYPPMAVKAQVEGKVILMIVVDERGDVLEATVVTASPPGIFEDAAIAAMLQWKFNPAKQRDLPIKVRLAYPIEFTLTGGIPPSE
ncbi:energy transducer TonB, partial [Gemmatimonadota bacterium]